MTAAATVHDHGTWTSCACSRSRLLTCGCGAPTAVSCTAQICEHFATALRRELDAPSRGTGCPHLGVLVHAEPGPDIVSMYLDSHENTCPGDGVGMHAATAPCGCGRSMLFVCRLCGEPQRFISTLPLCECVLGPLRGEGAMS